MSKVKRFSLEERYGYQNRKVIYDKNSDNDIELNNIYPIIDLFNQLDEQISDLEAKLEEKEKIIQMQQNIDRYDIGEMLAENTKLRQQLKSQPAEIVDKIRKQIFNHFNVKNMEEYESLSMLDSLFTADAVTDMLDDILKEYQKNKEEK